jgi:outer membrane protein OmpA-like peptidoglycan-associated protein
VNVPAAFIIRHSSFLLLSLLSSCSGISMPAFFKNPASEAVVYALGPRDDYASPLNDSLRPACPALCFQDDEFKVSEAHERPIRDLAKEMEKDKKARLLIAGYAPPNLPQEHARSISDRRALAVRQRFIELGIEPANLQTVGYGNDFSPSGPSSSVVVIYWQN